MIAHAELVVLFGATGKSGFHIANALINSGFAVRIIARSKAKVTKLFQQKQISFESIVEGPLNSSDVLAQAFRPSKDFGKVKYVVSALGITMGGKQSVEDIEYLAQVKIIDYSKTAAIDKYIFVTAVLMERPWHPIAVLLNTIVPSVYHWKAKAENHLRNSGLNYAIVRPPGLEGDYANFTKTEYIIGQGDKLSGKMSRYTLGDVIRDTIISKELPPKITFECIGVYKNDVTGLKFAQLKTDNEKNIVRANHRVPKAVYGLTLLIIIGYGVFFIVNKCLSN